MGKRVNGRLLWLLGVSSGVHAALLLALGGISSPDPGGGSRQGLRVQLQPTVTLSSESVAPEPLRDDVEPEQPSQLVRPQVHSGVDKDLVINRSVLPRPAPVVAVVKQTAPAIGMHEPRLAASATLVAASSEDRYQEKPLEASSAEEPVEQRVAELEPVMEAQQAEAEASLVPDQQQLAQLQSQAGQQLLQAMADYFRYPLKARRKGWQGDVLLNVELTKLGAVRQVELLQSSGYRVLDSAALDSMKQVDTIAMLSLSQDLSVQVPVSYRLIN